MATEITKRQQQDEQVATWRPLYAAAWETAFNEFMFLMAEQYSMELLIEIDGGKRVPSPTVKFWRESLADLSPLQMREGLRCYMDSERRSFKPTPGDIKENAPEATDKPIRRKDPNCPDCHGDGWRRVEVESKTRPGTMTTAVTDCYCVRLDYGGKIYTPAAKQLPDATEHIAQVVKQVVENTRSMPRITPLTDAEYNARLQELERQKQEILRQGATK